MKDRDIYIHIVQENNRDCWINPACIVRINAFPSTNILELMMIDSQIISLNYNNNKNQQLLNYLNLDSKTFLV